MIAVTAGARSLQQEESFQRFRSHDPASGAELPSLPNQREPSFLREDPEQLLEAYGLLRSGRTPRQRVGVEGVEAGDWETASQGLHEQTAVKRSNFLQLFVDEYQVDKFIAAHLYGANGERSLLDFSATDLSAFEESLLSRSQLD